MRAVSFVSGGRPDLSWAVTGPTGRLGASQGQSRSHWLVHTADFTAELTADSCVDMSLTRQPSSWGVSMLGKGAAGQVRNRMESKSTGF